MSAFTLVSLSFGSPSRCPTRDMAKRWLVLSSVLLLSRTKLLLVFCQCYFHLSFYSAPVDAFGEQHVKDWRWCPSRDHPQVATAQLDLGTLLGIEQYLHSHQFSKVNSSSSSSTTTVAACSTACSSVGAVRLL